MIGVVSYLCWVFVPFVGLFLLFVLSVGQVVKYGASFPGCSLSVWLFLFVVPEHLGARTVLPLAGATVALVGRLQR